MQNSIEQLKHFLNDGEYGCKILKSITAKELENFEKQHSISLPNNYKSLLTELGSLELFSSDYSAGIEILLPQDVEAFSRDVFDGYGDNPYPNLFLAINIPSTGWFGGFKLDEKSDENFAIFFPEVEPESWIEEADFISFKQWFDNVISSKGQALLSE